MAFQPNGKQIATGCRDAKLRLIDAMTGNVIRDIAHGGAVRGAGKF